MSSPFPNTIAAIATPAGRGAVALVRVSGRDALTCLRRVCPGADRDPPPARFQRLLAIHHPDSGERIDRALVTFFPAPNSYTGEDSVEVSTHGGPLTPQLVLGAFYAAGARPAEPGEFTRRAVYNGKLDLLQAEAVLDLIDGRSPALHRAAIFQMERGLSRRIEELRSAILHVEALVTYSIDFPEEDEPPVPAARVEDAALGVIDKIDKLRATAPQGELLREGAVVVLAGRPNSGKSSLFNALLGAERAIVTEIPGTTRDALEASILIGGYPFRVVDTAGLRETADLVEGIGIEVARRFLRAAHIVLFCAEYARPLDADELSFLADLDPGRVTLVRTKSDLPSMLPAEVESDAVSKAREEFAFPEVTVSALTGGGLADLQQHLLQRAFGGILHEPGEAPLITRERHVRALETAREELKGYVEASRGGVPSEFASTHLRAAAIALEDLIGVVSSDDVLGRIFSDFCVGK